MDIKPQDWYNTRYIDYIPKHFTKFKLSSTVKRLNLLSWIEFNTTGRFSIGKKITKIPGEVSSLYLKEEEYIAFENPADATMFNLFYKK